MTRSDQMRKVRSKNSAAEIALRSALHKAGLRFRVHRRIEGVSVDIAFVSPRVALFVDGCFWHGCPQHASIPKTNRDYWLPKLAENRARDERQTARLEERGWTVVRVWEHECLRVAPELVLRIRRHVERCRQIV